MIDERELKKRQEELSDQAWEHKAMPSGLNQPEQLFYLSMRSLYAEYKSGSISREEGERCKREIEKAFKTAAYNYDMFKQSIAQISAADCIFQKYKDIPEFREWISAVNGISCKIKK